MKMKDAFRLLCVAISFFFSIMFIIASDHAEAGLNDKAASENSTLKAGAGPKPGLQDLDDLGNMRISEEDRCPVCAMRVARHPKSSCAIQLKDDSTYYFCGTGCMIRTWLHPEVFLGARPEDVKIAVVQDYFTGDRFDAATAVWVAGSDVMGPMGPALVPLKDEGGLQTFMKRHGGKTVFRLQELDDNKWREITGKKALP